MRVDDVRCNERADTGHAPVHLDGAKLAHCDRWLWMAEGGDLRDVSVFGNARSKGTIGNIIRETVPRFIMFFVVGLFAGELRDRMSDLELNSSAWAFISIASIFFQNTVRQALDSREIVRIAIPFGTSVLWDLAIRFLEVGQKCGFKFNGASGPMSCCH